LTEAAGSATTASSATDFSRLPIFPLGTVLFPGGALPLRVFEARYVDMTRECMKSGSPFGVCLIKEGTEVGAPAVPHATGCLAEIRDWDMQQLGVLSIQTRGTRRFRIMETSVAPDGLIRARAEPIDTDAPASIRAEFSQLQAILRDIIPKVPAELIPEPHLFDDAIWLSNRLSELMPVPALAKQKLMELEDADMRLEIIYRFLGQQGLK
jgi:Lon protease-like protein